MQVGALFLHLLVCVCQKPSTLLQTGGRGHSGGEQLNSVSWATVHLVSEPGLPTMLLQGQFIRRAASHLRTCIGKQLS